MYLFTMWAASSAANKATWSACLKWLLTVLTNTGLLAPAFTALLKLKKKVYISNKII